MLEYISRDHPELDLTDFKVIPERREALVTHGGRTINIYPNIWKLANENRKEDVQIRIERDRNKKHSLAEALAIRNGLHVLPTEPAENKLLNMWTIDKGSRNCIITPSVGSINNLFNHSGSVASCSGASPTSQPFSM